jgi:hypothetical protein
MKAIIVAAAMLVTAIAPAWACRATVCQQIGNQTYCYCHAY